MGPGRRCGGLWGVCRRHLSRARRFRRPAGEPERAIHHSQPDADGDASKNADDYTYYATDGDENSHAHKNGNADARANCDCYADRHRNMDADKRSHADADSGEAALAEESRQADARPDGNRCAGCYRDSNGNGDEYAGRRLHRDANADTDGCARSNSHCFARADAYKQLERCGL